MSKYVIAGVGVANAYTLGTSPALIVTSNTLQEESLSLSVTGEDIRGGEANKLISRYFHDSLLESTLTDATFSLDYIAANCGGEVSTVDGSQAFTTETLTVTAGDDYATVAGTPVKFGNASAIGGWVSPVGEDKWSYQTFKTGTGNTQKINVPESMRSASADTQVCVKYCITKSMSAFTVPANVIPKTVHMVMTWPLFSAGASSDLASASQIGELIIDIPRFQFNGTFDMSLTSSGAATSNLSGQALASGTGSCDGLGQYATIKINEYSSNWYDNLEAIYIEDPTFTLTVGGTKQLAVYGVYTGAGISQIANSLLTFGVDAGGKISVDSTTASTRGTVTGVSAGTGTVTVTVTDMTSSPEAVAVVEVTA